jgi:CheY-like chemotaxis protein
MDSSASNTKTHLSVLLVEADVIVRFALAHHLRGCGHTVIEVVSGTEARAVLLAGPAVEVVLADAQLAGDDNGFALAQWVRRHRKSIDVVLTGTLAHKVQVACEFCVDGDRADQDAQGLTSRIQAMLAERKRRLRPAPKTAPVSKRKRY